MLHIGKTAQMENGMSARMKSYKNDNKPSQKQMLVWQKLQKGYTITHVSNDRMVLRIGSRVKRKERRPHQSVFAAWWRLVESEWYHSNKSALTDMPPLKRKTQRLASLRWIGLLYSRSC